MTHFSPGFITNPATGYTIENAVWFSSTSDTLTKTFSGAGDTQKAVISFWIKQCSAGANNKVFSDSGSDALNFLFNTNDEVRIRWTNAIATAFLSDGQFRDYTAWQHFALAIDMTQGTDTDRLKLYVNGVEATVNSTSYPARYATFTWNTAIEHVIHGAGEAEFYLAEFISLDGQSIVGGDLAITDLVDTDSNGVPVPVDPSELTFGTNGFWLDFSNSSHFGAAKLGYGGPAIGGVDLDGSSGKGTFTAAGGVSSGGGPFTFAAWIKPGSFVNNDGIVQIGAGGSATTCAALAMTGTSGAFQLARPGAGNFKTSTTPLVVGTWSFVAVTHAGGTVNGTNTKLLHNGSDQGTTGSYAAPTLTTNGLIGSQEGGGGTNTFDGEIAHVMIWDEVLTAAELLALYNSGTPLTPVSDSGNYASSSGLIHYFNMQENTGSVLDDTQQVANGALAGTYAWTVSNNFTDTSMTAAQQVTDSPTDDAGNDIGNFSLINANTPTAITLSEGNQRCAGTDQKLIGNIAVTRGSGVKLVVEFEIVNVANWTHLGMIGLDNASLAEQLWDNDGVWRLNYNSAGNFQFGGTDSSAPASYTTGDFIRMEADFDANSLEFFKNGVSQGGFAIPAGYDQWVWGSWLQGSSPTGDIRINTGQRAFNDTPTAGFKPWCTANLPAPTVTKPSNYFQAELTTHNGTSAVVVCNWDMDAANTLIISKNSDASEKWFVSNGAAGETKHMDFALTTASTTDSNAHSVIGANLTMGSAFAANDYMTYFIKAGATSGVGINSGVIHGNGGSTNVAHGLGVTPEAGWAKRTNSTGGWYAFTPGMTSQTDRHLFLDTTVAEQTVANVWGTHSPTNTVLGAGASGLADGTYDVVSFTSIAGFSKFTSYTGNGVVDGPYVQLGFRAKFFMIKGLTVSGSWTTHDTVRNAYNPSNSVFYFDAPNQSGSDGDIDVTANGLKIRGGPGNTNTSAEVYVVWAFAENPFGGSGVAQARAR